METLTCTRCSRTFDRPNARGRRPRYCPGGCPVIPAHTPGQPDSPTAWAWREQAEAIWDMSDPDKQLLLDRIVVTWGLIEQCEVAIFREGMFYTDRFNQPQRHPAVLELRNLQTGLRQLLRELGLQPEEKGDEPRLPRPVNLGGRSG